MTLDTDKLDEIRHALEGVTFQALPLDNDGVGKQNRWTCTLTRGGLALMTTYMHCKWEVFEGARRTVGREVKFGERLTLWIAEHSKPKAPELLDVVWSLCMDADTVRYGQTFEDWADELGYDSDSRKAEASYHACIDEWRGMIRLGLDCEKLSSLYQEAGY